MTEKIYVTKEQIKVLAKANELVKGTSDYAKYYIECEWKNDKGVWKFIGHTNSIRPGYVKKVRGQIYVYDEFNNRYRLTAEVMKVLGINS